MGNARVPLINGEDTVRRDDEGRRPSLVSGNRPLGVSAFREAVGDRRSGRCVIGATRAMLAIPLSLALMAGCAPPVAYALEQQGGEGLRASAVSAQEVDLTAADAAQSDLYELYLPVLFRAANGFGEFSENYKACDPDFWAPEYFLYDLGADGVPELMVRAKVFDGVNIVHVFSASSGKLASVGSYWEWFGGSAGNDAGELYAAGWNQGSSYVNAVSQEGDRIASRFLKSGKSSSDKPTGEMQMVNDFLASHGASWIDASPIANYSLLEQKARYSLSKGTIAVAAGAAYTGKRQTPQVTVKFGKGTLREGVDYTVSYKDNVNAGLATATVTGVGNYQGTLSACFTIGKADIARASVKLEKAGAYTGSAKTPSAVVKDASATLRAGVDYSIAYKDNKNAGTAVAVVAGRGNYQGSKNVKFVIAKAKNPMKLKAVEKTLTARSLAKKSRTIKVLQFQERARGKLSYANASSASVQKAVSVDSSTGALTVKQGTKARSYTVRIRVSAAGDSNHLAASKTMSTKVIVV